MQRSHCRRDFISSPSPPISKVLARCWSLPTATFWSANPLAAAFPASTRPPTVHRPRLRTPRSGALVSVYAASPAAAKIYATGMRNCLGLNVQPGSGALWCTTNERDALGDDLVPDYSTRVWRGGYYGWPWYFLGSNEDPRLQGQRPELRRKVPVAEL